MKYDHCFKTTEICCAFHKCVSTETSAPCLLHCKSTQRQEKQKDITQRLTWATSHSASFCWAIIWTPSFYSPWSRSALVRLLITVHTHREGQCRKTLQWHMTGRILFRNVFESMNELLNEGETDYRLLLHSKHCSHEKSPSWLTFHLKPLSRRFRDIEESCYYSWTHDQLWENTPSKCQSSHHDQPTNLGQWGRGVAVPLHRTDSHSAPAAGPPKSLLQQDTHSDTHTLDWTLQEPNGSWIIIGL